MRTELKMNELTVLVTGGTSGLGQELVRQLVAQGARVAFVARSQESVERVAEETGALGIVGDVGKKDDIYPIALQVTGAFQGLDVLINNASSLGPVPLRNLSDTPCEALEESLAVNLVGPFRLTKALFGALTAASRERGRAIVINVSSDAAVHAYAQWGAYGAGKAGLRHLTAIWHEEARAHDVTFLSVDPGDMNTPLHSLAVPDADPSALKDPSQSATEIIETIRESIAENAQAEMGS